MKLQATHLRDRRYAVRPEGCDVGTCGWINGHAWQAIYVTASSPEQAITRAHKMHWWTRDGEEVK